MLRVLDSQIRRLVREGSLRSIKLPTGRVLGLDAVSRIYEYQ
jgi:hypothetical protein